MMNKKNTKKHIAVLWMVIWIFCLTSCANISEDTDDIASVQNEGCEIQAIALNEVGGSLMFYTLNGINSMLISVNTRNAELTSASGTVILPDDFKTEQLVIIKYDGLIAASYPGQINKCYSIHVIGKANERETEEALSEYIRVHTTERTIHYVDDSLELAKKTVQVTFGNVFGEWQFANDVPALVKLLEMSAEDNAWDETNKETKIYHAATIRTYHLDLSEAFLTYLTSAADEQMIVDSLVKTIIGDNPPAKDTAVVLTVDGSELITEKNDFSGRLK